MKLVLISLVAMALIACNKSDDKKGDGKSGKLGTDNSVDTTDRSVCHGATPAGMNITSKMWKMTSASDDGFSETQLFSINNNSVSVYATCLYKDIAVTASARVNASVTTSTLEILSDDTDTAKATMEDGQEFSCTVSLERSPVINYDFQGPCLRLQLQGETVVLVPNN